MAGLRLRFRQQAPTDAPSFERACPARGPPTFWFCPDTLATTPAGRVRPCSALTSSPPLSSARPGRAETRRARLRAPAAAGVYRLLAAARRIARLRDGGSLFGYLCAGGHGRRALLEVGRRVLPPLGAKDPADICYASREELKKKHAQPAKATGKPKGGDTCAE